MEVLQRPQYQRLQIGSIADEEPVLRAHSIGDLSKVPYGEPTWLSAGFHSPYYNEVNLPYSALRDASNANIESQEVPGCHERIRG